MASLKRMGWAEKLVGGGEVGWGASEARADAGGVAAWLEVEAALLPCAGRIYLGRE